MFNSNRKNTRKYLLLYDTRKSEKEINNITSLFFKYDKEENKNIFLDSKEYSLNEEIKENIITSEIMLDRNQEKVIVCFYQCDVSKIGTFYINPNNNAKIEIEKKNNRFLR